MDNNNMFNETQQSNENQNQQSNPYQVNQGQQYQANYQSDSNYSYSDLEEPVSVGDWLITMLIMLIPCVNVVMLFVWAFGGGNKTSKSNFFKAYLIMLAIGIVLSIICIATIGATFAAVLESMI